MSLSVLYYVTGVIRVYRIILKCNTTGINISGGRSLY